MGQVQWFTLEQWLHFYDPVLTGHDCWDPMRRLYYSYQCRSYDMIHWIYLSHSLIQSCWIGGLPIILRVPPLERFALNLTLLLLSLALDLWDLWCLFCWIFAWSLFSQDLMFWRVCFYARKGIRVGCMCCLQFQTSFHTLLGEVCDVVHWQSFWLSVLILDPQRD